MELSKNDKQNLKTIGLHEHQCSVCGKLFECRAEYAYKTYKQKEKGIVYYCSYSCMRKAEKDEHKK